MAKLDLSSVPQKITITNKGTEDAGFRYFRVNFIEVVKPKDEIVIAAQSSEEAAYYLALADANIGLSVTAAAME